MEDFDGLSIIFLMDFSWISQHLFVDFPPIFPMVLVVQALSIGFLGGGQMCEALLGGLLAQGTTEATWTWRAWRGEEFAADVLPSAK